MRGDLVRTVTGDFVLTADELRVVVRYVATAAEAVLPRFEAARPEDARPREALAAAHAFLGGEWRGRWQRVASLDAHRAAREARDEVVRLAAQAAGDAASAAYLHPIAKAHQVGHVLRASATRARLAEIEEDDVAAAERVLLEEHARAGPVLADVLRRYPSPSPGGSRPAQLMARLDAAIRG